MTSKAALCMALLEGRVLNVKNVFETIGLTNCAREISRMIEQPFGVTVSRVRKEGVSRYGQPVSWVDYRLNRSEHNIPGIQKMIEYCKKHSPSISEAKTNTQLKQYTQTALFLNNF